MGHLQRLPVLIRDEAGLNQEAVDDSECHRKHNNSGSQLTCGVQEESLHISGITDVLSSQDAVVWSTTVFEISHRGNPPSLRGLSSSFEYSWVFRCLSFTSSTLFPDVRRVRMFSIRTLCLSAFIPANTVNRSGLYTSIT